MRHQVADLIDVDVAVRVCGVVWIGIDIRTFCQVGLVRALQIAVFEEAVIPAAGRAGICRVWPICRMVIYCNRVRRVLEGRFVKGSFIKSSFIKSRGSPLRGALVQQIFNDLTRAGDAVRILLARQFDGGRCLCGGGRQAIEEVGRVHTHRSRSVARGRPPDHV